MPDLVGAVANMTRKDIRIGISASALECRAYGVRHMACMGGPAHQLVHKSGGLQISVTPRRVSTFGAQRSGQLTPLRPRRSCTQ